MAGNNGTRLESQKIEINISDDTREKIVLLMNERGWDWEEGLRLILGAGLGFYLAQNPINGEGENSHTKLIRQYMSAESELASLRFKVYELSESNRNWNLTQGAIEKENIALKNLVEQLREKNC
ncbi:MAG: hypothetical protein GYA12_05190 [Chloroflexi bacterium]|jgi:hypothetical protein|nr:hypothetical protein [Chloroflexota bacterium]